MVEFRTIRPVRGSANNGFEELCCQLAHADEKPTGGRFTRNGTPDGGVECYWAAGDGTERGWQAKYFFAVGDSQWAQLDESVETALEKHPGLSEYTICLPIDLPDARIPNQKSLRQKWDERVKKWEELAQQSGRSVTFTLWGEHELLDRLAAERHAGRRWFWFRDVELSAAWLATRLEEAVEAAGPRYTPELNVDLPIAQAFESLAYSEPFRQNLFGHRARLRDRFEDVRGRAGGWPSTEEVTGATARLQAAGEALGRYLTQYAADATATPPADPLPVLINDCDAAIDDVIGLLRTSPAPSRSSSRPFEYDLHQLSQYRNALNEFGSFLETAHAGLAGRPRLLLAGDAGSGKTHLLCDVAGRRVAAQLPTVLVLAQQLGPGDIWGQVLRRLGLSCTRDEFLGALDAAGEAAGGRALLLIDAINEATDIDWQTELPPVLTVLSRFPHVGVAVSCRTTYERLLVRDDLASRGLTRVEHAGFAGRVFDAVAAFCRHYGLETLNAPPLDPEFENPLFLKLFCQGLRNRGLRRPPQGHRGIRQVFSFLLDSVNRKLHAPGQLDFPPDDPVVDRAVDAVADLMLGRGRYAVPRGEVREVLDQILPRPARGYSESLLAKLISEGILADDLQWSTADEPPAHVVRFGYQRLADYLIARRLLDRHLDRDDPAASFGPGKPLGRLFTPATGRSTGLWAALAVLVPELIGRELSTLLPAAVAGAAEYRAAFLESLPWRDGQFVRPEAAAFVRGLLDEGDPGNPNYCPSDAAFDALLRVAAQPGHPLNAAWLHEHLRSFAMPDRDRRWSTYLHRAERDRGRPAGRRGRAAVPRLGVAAGRGRRPVCRVRRGRGPADRPHDRLVPDDRQPIRPGPRDQGAGECLRAKGGVVGAPARRVRRGGRLVRGRAAVCGGVRGRPTEPRPRSGVCRGPPGVRAGVRRPAAGARAASRLRPGHRGVRPAPGL